MSDVGEHEDREEDMWPEWYTAREERAYEPAENYHTEQEHPRRRNVVNRSGTNVGGRLESYKQ